MNRIKVFISYNWDIDQDLRNSTHSGLRTLENVEVIYDASVVRVAENIHETISQTIHECDCLIVPFTSLMSKEVISELIRAHECRKKIIVVQKRRADSQPQIPPYLYFLTDSLMVEYSTSDDLNSKLIDYFESKSKDDFQIVPQEIVLMKNSIDLCTLIKFRSELIKIILDEAYKEIKKVKDQDQEYKIDVGVEKNFLIRARSLFENADEVYAISNESVSTFWTDSKNRLLAKDYIDKQPRNTIRLFVFSSIRTANKYRFILQASHNRYGRDGGVFICSLNSYIHFLEKFSNGHLDIAKAYLYQDFGILVYDYGSDKSYIEALLDHSELMFKNIDIDGTGKINYKDIIPYLNNLKNLDHENLFEDMIGDKKIYIKRWNSQCLNSNEVWKKDLKKLFTEERSGEAYHLVFFKDYYHNLERKILEVKNTLNNCKENLGIKYIWFGKKTERIPITDFSYGHLKLNFDYDYILIMRFDSHNDLRNYYSNQFHSKIRKNLYSNFNEGLRILYQYVDNLRQTNPRDSISVFEQVIEDIVDKYMVRYDFVDEEDIDSIIQEAVYPFPYVHENDLA